MAESFTLSSADMAQLRLMEKDEGFHLVLAEHPEIKILYERRNNYPAFLQIHGVNPIFHVLMEGVVENQLRTNPAVREIWENLQRTKNLAPHAARASMAAVLIHYFFPTLQDHEPFHQEAYLRSLRLIGMDVSKVGRNDLCPCGSGIKYKRCCAPCKDYFEVFPLAGTLDLGHGAYPPAEPEDIQDPLDPIFQLEARVHIAAYMEEHQDPEGALAVLKENITLAESYKGGAFLSDAWQHYLLLCQNHKEFRHEGLEAINHLISLAKNDTERGTLFCDKGDILFDMGDVEAAEAEYSNLFKTFPDFSQGHVRYASLLCKQNREQDAKKVLTDLLSEVHIDQDTRWDAIDLLEDLGRF
ncbi:hypothetical protein CEB3_c35930 [Peptococcaceae bacterium CEB3]|nr:hypothetical protein CEB3_c35930 [Peptococcaceae bacterium CEB3]